MTTVLIDGDIVCFRCAASCAKQGKTVDPVEVATHRMDDLMLRIIAETEAQHYRAFIGGTDNFRKKIYPAYKANRKDMVKPEWLEACREHMVVNWQGEIVNGMETDDMLGICQTSDSVIASIDKDLLMIPGKHYNFVRNEFYEITPLEGVRHFWFQMIMGDRTDNIPGFDGTARQTVPKFLNPLIADLGFCETEEDMKSLVKGVYTDQAQFEINQKLLWILREFPSSSENIPQDFPEEFDGEDLDYFS